MVAVFAGLLYLKRRGTLAALDAKGFDNPSFNRSAAGPRSAGVNPAFDNSQGVVNFGTDNP